MWACGHVDVYRVVGAGGELMPFPNIVGQSDN